MTQPNSTTQALTSSDCDPIFTSGSITLVLDAPRQSIATQALPANFRTLQKIPKISGAATSGSVSNLRYYSYLVTHPSSVT